MQTIDLHAWCFLSGRICALEDNLLRKDCFERLLPLEEPVGAQHAVPLLTCLKETPLRDDFLTAEDVLNFEEILHRRFFHCLQEVKELSPTLWVWELIQTRYDLINLKNFLKEKLFGLKRPIPFPSPYTDETWTDFWEGHEVSFPPLEVGARHAVPLLSETTSLFLWQTVLGKMALEDLRGHLGEISEDPGILDLILDGAYLSGIPQLAERTASQFIMDYCLEYQKLMGILFSWRVRYQESISGRTRMKYAAKYIPSPEGTLETEKAAGAFHESALTKYEKTAEDTLMDRLVAAKLFVFGPERVFGYLKGLETETLNLRLTIGGRLQGVPPEDIKQRLHKGYV